MIPNKKKVVEPDELDKLANYISSMDMRSRSYLNGMINVMCWYKDGDGDPEQCAEWKAAYRAQYKKELEDTNGNN